MGTPCAIGMEMADGSVHAIRCNYDGYVAGAGAILADSYTEASKIEALLALGNLSELASELPDCVAYHRDRNEPMRSARHFTDVKEYQRVGKGEMAADYLYLYNGGKWRIYGLHNTSRWVTLDARTIAKNR